MYLLVATMVTRKLLYNVDPSKVILKIFQLLFVK